MITLLVKKRKKKPSSGTAVLISIEVGLHNPTVRLSVDEL